MRRNNLLIYGLFISVGIIFLLLSYTFDQNFNYPLLSNVTLNIGIVVLSLILIDLLWRLVGGEPISEQLQELRSINKFNAEATVNGLVGIYSVASDIPSSLWLELIRNSKSQIDIASHTQSQFITEPYLWEAIVNRVKNGVKVRLLMDSPGNPSLNHKSYPAGHLKTMHRQMEHAWEEYQSIIAILPSDLRKNLTVVQLSDEILFNAIRRFDEKIFIIHYINSDYVRTSPVFVVEGSNKSLFRRYLKEFEYLFSRNIDKLTTNQ